MTDRPRPTPRLIEGVGNPDGRPWFELPPNDTSAYRWGCRVNGRKHLEIVRDWPLPQQPSALMGRGPFFV